MRGIGKMRQQVNVLFLLLSLLQPALWCVQCHADCGEHDASGKSQSPHFHLGFLCAARCDSEEASVRLSRATLVEAGVESADDQDNDAIYLPISVVHGWANDRPNGSVTALPIAVAATPISLSPVFPPAMASPRAPCEVVSRGDCPVFLRHSALLI